MSEKILLERINSLLEEFGIFVFDVSKNSCPVADVINFTFYANHIVKDSANDSYMEKLNDVIVGIFNACNDVFDDCYQNDNNIIISSPFIIEKNIIKALDTIYLGLIGNYELYKNGCPFKLDKEELRKIFKECESND